MGDEMTTTKNFGATKDTPNANTLPGAQQPDPPGDLNRDKPSERAPEDQGPTDHSADDTDRQQSEDNA